LVYRDASKIYEKLRAKIRTIGISTVARAAKVSRSVIKAFLNQRTVPPLDDRENRSCSGVTPADRRARAVRSATILKNRFR
jgi:hypothetical protein